MSCTGCAAKFSLFKSEKSCPQCGFSFCSKCLSEKAVVKKSGNSNNKPVAVCRNCAAQLSAAPAKIQNIGTQELPNAAPAANKEPASGKMPIIIKPKIYETTTLPPPDENNKNDVLDQRLKNLKKDRAGQVFVSQTELENRLSKLKGVDPNEARASAEKPFQMPVDRRTATEQARDLLTQFTEEVAIDTKRLSPAEEIEQRLAKLKGQQYQPKSSNPDINPESFLSSNFSNPDKNDDMSGKDLDEVHGLLKNDFEKSESTAKRDLDDLNKEKEIQDYLKLTEAKRAKRKQQDVASADLKDGKAPVVETLDEDDEGDGENEENEANRELKRIFDEIRLEKKQESLEAVEEFGEPLSPREEDEVPYCCICNEDPVLRCMDCDGDLYCRRCFKEGHDKEDNHKIVAYKFKKPKTTDFADNFYM